MKNLNRRMNAWTEKFMPKSVADLVIDKRGIDLLRDFVVNFDKQKKNGAIIWGRSGCGKTCSVYALASDLGYEVLEINASDVRNKNLINETVGGSIKQQSLFSKGKIILIDEIDGLSGVKDRGGTQALTKLLEENYWPIILTANDPWQNKLKELRNKSLLIEFKEPGFEDITKVLKKICEKEKIKIEKNILIEIVKNSNGDLRAAINDLQTIAEGRKEIKKEDILLFGREKRKDVFNALNKIFKSKDLGTLSVFDNAGLSLDEGMLWVDENLPLEYRGTDLREAYDKLSKADVFRGRILRWQYWRFLVYQNALMTVGIAVSKTSENDDFINYKRPTRILKLWRAKMKYQKRKAIAEKLAKHTHSSAKKLIKELDYFKHVLVKGGIAEELELSKDEVLWLIR